MKIHYLGRIHIGPTILLIQGLPEDRITLTRVADPEVDPPAWPSDIRLVDDQSVMYGRLQVHYKGHWRGVCANSQKSVILLYWIAVLVARIKRVIVQFNSLFQTHLRSIVHIMSQHNRKMQKHHINDSLCGLAYTLASVVYIPGITVYSSLLLLKTSTRCQMHI